MLVPGGIGTPISCMAAHGRLKFKHINIRSCDGVDCDYSSKAVSPMFTHTGPNSMKNVFEEKADGSNGR